MKVSIMGAGYVGTVVGCCLAKFGNEVIMVDIDNIKIDMIAKRRAPIFEEGLDEILSSAELKLEATCDVNHAVTNSDVIFICVPTPDGEEGAPDLRHLQEASKNIGDALREKKSYHLVVVKSTTAPGVTDGVVVPLLEKYANKEAGEHFGVCTNPEFLREGKAVYDFLNPARIIIGELDRRSGDVLAQLYREIRCPVLRVDLRTAEMIKCASNAFLATKISFINEIGNICKLLGIDIHEVARGMGYDERIGNTYLDAGIGFGGSCLPKDVKGLIATARDVGYEPKVLGEVLDLNQRQAQGMLRLLKKHIPSLQNKDIGILGLAFKPGTEDVRDSQAISVASALLAEGANIKAYDPIAVENFRGLFPQIEYVGPEEVMKCDAILILTEWDEFNQLDYRQNVVIDGRGIVKAEEARIYEGLCW